MRATLLLAAAVLSLAALAPTASAHMDCTLHMPMPSEDGLVWDAYVFGVNTTQAVFCFGYDGADRTCHFLVGGVCLT